MSANAATIPFSGGKSSPREKRRLHQLAQFSARLEADGWLSPDSYGRDFATARNVPAVYMFLAVDMHDMTRFHVAYVGMSTQVAKRWAAHPTLRKIQRQGLYIKRLFKLTPKESLRAEERRYIQEFTPPWNIIGRVPGQ